MLHEIKEIETRLRALYHSVPIPSPQEKWQAIVKHRDQLHALYPKANKDAFKEASKVAFVPSAFFPSQKQVDTIKLVVGERLLLDIGLDVPQKSGATAAVLHHLAHIQVKCYNPTVFKADPYFEVQEWHPVKVVEANRTTSCVLGLFHPTKGDTRALAVLEKYLEYGGDAVLVSGSKERVGTEAFWKLLDGRLTLAKVDHSLVVYPYLPRAQWAMNSPLWVYLKLHL